MAEPKQGHAPVDPTMSHTEGVEGLVILSKLVRAKLRRASFPSQATASVISTGQLIEGTEIMQQSLEFLCSYVQLQASLRQTGG